METVTFETIALLPDGRPVLSFGARGHDPALAGGLTSAVYSFTREIDLRKNPADGLRIDVPGGGKLILRRAVVNGREVFVSVIVRGVINEQVLSLLSDFGHIFGEVLASRGDWNEIKRGEFSSLFARKADIYLETLKRWRGSTKTHLQVTIDFRDIIKRALTVLGKTINLSEPFIRIISDQNLALSEDELTTLVAKEMIIMASDQELFLTLNSKDDPWRVALTVANELKTMRSQASSELRKITEEIKTNFVETIGGSINGETAFFRLSERRETWNTEFIHAAYNRMSKRFPLLLLAHPSLNGTSGVKGLREMASEFIETFLAEKGPYGAIRRLITNLKVDAALSHFLGKFVGKCGPSFDEFAACLLVKLVEPERLRETLPKSLESDALCKSFEKSLADIQSRDMSITESPECSDVRERLYTTIAESYGEILEEILSSRDLFIDTANRVREYLVNIISLFQIIAAINALAQFNWRVVPVSGHIPSYGDLISTALMNQTLKKENGMLIFGGKRHSEASVALDPLLLRGLWGDWRTVSMAIREKMAKTLKNEFQTPLILFLQSYAQTMKENFKGFATYIRSVAGGNVPTIELEKPRCERKLYTPVKDECEKMYGAITASYEKLTSFVNKSVEEVTGSQGEKRAGYAKQVLYTLDKIEKEYILEPERELGKEIEECLDRAVRRLESDISNAKEKLDSNIKLRPSFPKYVNGTLEDPSQAIKSYKLPPVENFFEGGYQELLSAYSSVILGLGVPARIAKRGVSQLNERRNVSPILKPLLKMKEANLNGLVSMHLSEYVRIFVESVFSFIRKHVDGLYVNTMRIEDISIGRITGELMKDPIDYVGKPLGIGCTRDENGWVFKILPPGQSSTEPSSLQKWTNGLFTRLVEGKYGITFEILFKAGKLLGEDKSKRIKEGIQKSTETLLSSTMHLDKP